jgi:hypothetical protein
MQPAELFALCLLEGLDYLPVALQKLVVVDCTLRAMVYRGYTMAVAVTHTPDMVLQAAYTMETVLARRANIQAGVVAHIPLVPHSSQVTVEIGQG